MSTKKNASQKLINGPSLFVQLLIFLKIQEKMNLEIQVWTQNNALTLTKLIPFGKGSRI